MRTTSLRIRPALAGTWLLVLASSAWALKPPGITENEMSLLPSYCRDAQGFGYGDASSNTSPRARGWVATMGNSFWHIHHHCWALINVRRAQAPLVPAERKRALYQEALGDFQYVVQNSPKDFVLLPEIFTWMGRVQAYLKQPQAAESFARARVQKPDYWPAYFHMAEFLKANGKPAEALQVVRAGLQQAPGTKSLLMLYQDLGGKPADIPPPLPKPEPAAAAEAAPVPANEAPAAATGPAAPPVAEAPVPAPAPAEPARNP